MKKNGAFRRAAALMAALSITVSLAAPAFAATSRTYYIDDGDITITKDENGQTVQQVNKQDENIGADEEIIITTHKKAITSLESDLEGPAAEDSGFGPVVEDNYQPAQPEDAEEPEGADQPEDAEQPEGADQPESAEEPEGADQQESAEQQAQPQQAAPAAVPATPTPANGFCKNIITVINNAATALKLTLRDVKIDVSDTGNSQTQKSGKAALSVQGSGDVEIELDGDNELKSGFNRAGLEKNTYTFTSAGTLTLKDSKGTASGSLKAEGGECGAGIGSRNYKNGENITITGGTVNATGGQYGAGIGGGQNGSGENITITGGTVNAVGGQYGAGIGGGFNSSGKNITIKGGTVTATDKDSGAGIGGGWKGNGENITIEGGTVTAIGGNEGGAGIGGGYDSSGKNITISGGTVNATGGLYGGAGIGGGHNGSGSNVKVSGDAKVTAVAGGWKSKWNRVGATIGDGDKRTYENGANTYSDGKEIQADISGLITGYIHHMIYNQDGSLKREWWEPERPQPNPESPQPNPESPQPNPEDPNAPAEETNEVSLGNPGLHVETLEGSLLPFDARQQGSTLRVTTDNLSARLHGTRQALETLQEQGVEQIQFVTTLKTTTLSVEDLLAEGGSWFALEHDGLGSRRLSAAQAESLKCWRH